MNNKDKNSFESQYIQQLTFDEPIQYKNLVLYPVKIKDYLNFNRWIDCFTLDKDKTADPEIMRMSYFKYLISTSYMYAFILLMQLVTHTSLIETNSAGNIIPVLDESNKPIFSYGIEEDGNSFFMFKEIKYNSSDFESIKKIICLQNNVDLEDDVRIATEFKEKMDKALQFINKNSGEVASLRELISRLAISSGFTKEYIHSLTILTFHDMLDSMDVLMNYKILKTGEASGMVKYKEPIPHWKFKIKKASKYDSVILDKEVLDAKLEQVK